MGLLLIEKKEHTSKCEEFQESLLEMQQVLKQENEELQKAFAIQNQYVIELENEYGAIREKFDLQQQQFFDETRRFNSFVETLKSCPNCSDRARSYLLPGLKSSESGGLISWLLRMFTTKFFRLSPSKGAQDVTSQNKDVPTSVNKIRANSSIAGKAQDIHLRKQRREGAGDDCDGPSEGVSDCRKRHQTGASFVGTQYNLLRNTNKGQGIIAVSVDSGRKTDKEVCDATLSQDNEITPAQPPDEASSQNENPEQQPSRTSAEIAAIPKVNWTLFIKGMLKFYSQRLPPDYSQRLQAYQCNRKKN